MARRRVLEALPAASIITDAEHHILYANPAFLELTGYREDDLHGQTSSILLGAQTDPATVAELRDRMTAGEDFQGEILNYRANGEPFWNRLAVKPIRDDSGTVTHYISSELDITAEVERRQFANDQRETAEMLLALSSRLATARMRDKVAREIADSLRLLGFDRSAVALLDETRTHLRMAAVAGWPPDLEAAAGRYSAPLAAHPELADVIARPRQRLVTEESASERLRREFASFHISGYLVTPVAHADSEPHGLLVVYWASGAPPADVPRLMAERLSGIAALASVALDNVDHIERIRREADEDPLTGLGTRVMLDRQIARALRLPSWTKTAVVYGDIDRFKRVNDAVGHAGGDELLRQVADRIKSTARSGDTIARTGGDEFVAVLPGVRDPSDVEDFIARLEHSLQSPFHIAGRRIFITMSVGWATASNAGISSPEEAADDLLHAADSRMYEAKQRRRRPESNRAEELAIDTELHDAVQNGDILAHFQPQYDLRTGRLSGYEALARWHHRERGAVAPATFIPLAEEDGLIHALGRQVLEQACQFVDLVSSQHASSPRMQVNVSTLELARPGYAAETLERLAAYRDRKWRLSVEVTESALILDRPRVEDALEMLRAHGVGVAVDDFGTGYSSLSQLRELPATELKIDQTFVQREGAVGRSLIRAIIALGHDLQLDVIAEGVETEEQLTTLRQMGCDHAQGFALALPLPPDAALEAPPTLHDAIARRRAASEGPA